VQLWLTASDATLARPMAIGNHHLHRRAVSPPDRPALDPRRAMNGEALLAFVEKALSTKRC